MDIYYIEITWALYSLLRTSKLKYSPVHDLMPRSAG